MEIETAGQGPEQPHRAKAEWKAPTLEEVHYSATEASHASVNPANDGVVYQS